ncbi:hypothetical protein [Microvirga arsenatis]|uniref:Uncharacterized protein n=1 Tax=Microvirga arsenatis TaxID=2692265 RepID=A0ABW9YVM8_9HYPH|nr:hypothetical protein [Microvirga arsenatis]NBJ13334.1 hypothetical protein [Microvirga arsenatis]NBJ24118.1 hypothetical protein [Microvirga arsenatis]
MAQKAKFAKDYDYRVSFGKEVAYKKGFEGLIPEAHYEAAKAAGVLEGEAAPAQTEAKAKAKG